MYHIYVPIYHPGSLGGPTSIMHGISRAVTGPCVIFSIISRVLNKKMETLPLFFCDFKEATPEMLPKWQVGLEVKAGPADRGGRKPGLRGVPGL